MRQASGQHRLLQTFAIAILVASRATTVSATGADQAAYTVANYPVEARAVDAVTAKNTAIAEGQEAALRSLLRRIVPVTAYKRLKAMTPFKAADAISGVSVRKERNSSTEYIATLDFSFEPGSIRNSLNRAGIPYVDEQAPQIMLIPIWRDGSGAAPLSGKGPWFDAWNGLDLAHTLAPLRLEGLRPEISVESLKPVLDGAGTAPALASAYRTETVVIALAEPDASGNKLAVTLAGRDAVGAFLLKRSYRITGGDRAYTSELAAVVGLGVLEGRWKMAKAGGGGSSDGGEGAEAGPIRLAVEFGSLSEWNDIRARILETDGAYDIEIASVSARGAEVVLRHAGGSQGLAQAFARGGLAMSGGPGAWRLKQTF